jgi:hypothetical protein
MPLLQLLLAVTAVVKSIANAVVGMFEELVQARDLATRHRQWAQDGITALSLKESGTAAL